MYLTKQLVVFEFTQKKIFFANKGLIFQKAAQ